MVKEVYDYEQIILLYDKIKLFVNIFLFFFLEYIILIFMSKILSKANHDNKNTKQLNRKYSCHFRDEFELHLWLVIPSVKLLIKLGAN